MTDHVYGVTEIVGSSRTSIDDAIQRGVRSAGESLRHLGWFEVTQIKGHVIDGEVAHFQVMMKLGFRCEPK